MIGLAFRLQKFGAADLVWEETGEALSCAYETAAQLRYVCTSSVPGPKSVAVRACEPGECP